jgi:hypothetical protein
MTAVNSQQTSWWSVHEHVAPMLEQVGSWPAIGTPAWCQLPDDDPAKVAALYDAARHWALRLECHQFARREASRDIAAGTNWSGIAQSVRARAGVYIPREVA